MTFILISRDANDGHLILNNLLHTIRKFIQLMRLFVILESKW